MKIVSFLLIPLSLSILNASCSKKVKYSKEELLKIALKADPSVSFILPRSMSEGVTCAEYTEGCLSAHITRVKGLDLIAVEFTDMKHAERAAKKFRGYYSRNWFFDDVRGEPVLERFVIEHLEAKKP
jgi:peptide deformylase